MKIKVIVGGKLFYCNFYFYSIDKVNQFLEANKDYGVLAIKGKRIYVAKLDDNGVKP